MTVSVTLVHDNRSGGRKIGLWPPTDLFQGRVDNGLIRRRDRRPMCAGTPHN
ncbi:hypothetical protein RD149_21615 [Gordonia westfalica]|uniref:Uncharacterized protein n=1 Tax=Gordonia westfalica TaxID=158898 RepID=A0ABU2GY13_9ACTN|nr:hypothetical protein [Gordonia westfalica]MDS1116345.1 hypothetical protein [Gordonia westfalica]